MTHELPIIDKLTRLEGYMCRPVNPDGFEAAAIIRKMADRIGRAQEQPLEPKD